MLACDLSNPGMRRQEQGWCLNISSRTAEQGEPPYPASKIAAHVIGDAFTLGELPGA